MPNSTALQRRGAPEVQRANVRAQIAAALIAGSAAGAAVAAIVLLAAGIGGGGESVREAAQSAAERVLDDHADDHERLLHEEAVREIAAASVERALDAHFDDHEPALHERVVGAYARAAPSLVIIDAEGEERTDEQGITRVAAAVATGIVLDGDGHVLTAAHVIEDMRTFAIITSDGGRVAAERVSDDAPYTDVAVLRAEPQALLPASFDLAPRVAGETVLAIGNTLLGRDIAVTVGVVSDPDAAFQRERIIAEPLIQTDAALNYGNSGGALVSLEGDVIGLTTFIARETRDGDWVDGVGFALPMSEVLPIARRIAAEGYYPRPTFGVVHERLLSPAAAVELELGVSRGAFLIEIKSRGVFARAGIRPGDVVREIDGIEIGPDMPYLNAMMTLAPGRPVDVIIHDSGRDVRYRLAPELRLP